MRIRETNNITKDTGQKEVEEHVFYFPNRPTCPSIGAQINKF